MDYLYFSCKNFLQLLKKNINYDASLSYICFHRFQDLFLVLSITTMLMTFFSTYLFQVSKFYHLIYNTNYSFATLVLELHVALLQWINHD